MTKVCTKCKLEKDVGEFSKHHRSKDGLQMWCKLCLKKYRTAYIQTLTGKLTDRNAYCKRKYGVTLEWYNEMLQKQNGVCAICGNPETYINERHGKVRGLDIDHNHNTKKVRGLLCHRCNLALGGFNVDNESIELLCSAISYIRNTDDFDQ